MSLLAIPNVSEGRRGEVLEIFASRIRDAGARVLDVHSDPAHDRTVFTVTGAEAQLVEAMTALAVACRDEIDLGSHAGIHPRFGALDVCPFVPLGDDLTAAVQTASAAARRIAEVPLPVYLYGAVSPTGRQLPDLRRQLRQGSSAPDLGPASSNPRTGVVCVGARTTLIAFNVWLRSGIDAAREIARRVRSVEGGRPGIRALGLQIDERRSQVSMNLTQPEETGIDEAFDLVAALASQRGIEVEASEIVGLVPERFLPTPDREAARRLLQPGRSLESAIADL